MIKSVTINKILKLSPELKQWASFMLVSEISKQNEARSSYI